MMKARTILTLFVAVCVTIAAIVWLGPVYRDNRQTKDSLRRLQANLEQQNKEIGSLNRELTKLRTDCRTIERVAREKFGLCREDERIYHFESAPDRPERTGEGEAAAADSAVDPLALP